MKWLHGASLVRLQRGARAHEVAVAVDVINAAYGGPEFGLAHPLGGECTGGA